MPIHRVTTVPRPPEAGRPDPGPTAMVAAVTAVHATLADEPDGGVFVAGWIRPAGNSWHVLVGAAPGLPGMPIEAGKPGIDVPVPFPAGARGRPLAAGEGAHLVAGFDHWVPITGRPDGLWGEPGGEGAARRGSFDDCAAHVTGPVAWLVSAEPATPQAVDAELAALAVQIPRLRQRDTSEPDRVELARAEARYREVSRARTSGLWWVRILVGAVEPGQAWATAAILCGASELHERPYTLTPGSDAAPFLASTDLLAAIARPPRQELPGIELLSPHTFDVTGPAVGDDAITVGAVLDRGLVACGDFSVTRSTLNRHVFVCGATGSGKSQTTRTMLEALARHPDPVPWLVIEPAKAEYAAMAGRLVGVAEVTVIRPGDPDTAPASLNPLEPEPGYPLQSHADLVRALFLAAFDAEEPFPQVLSRALTDVYTRAGWDMVTSRPRPARERFGRRGEPVEPLSPPYPRLGELQSAARAVVDAIGYASDITSNVRGFVDVRLGSLRTGTPGRFFEGGHPLDVGALLAGNVVLELDAITGDDDKAFLIGAVLIRIVEHLRVHAGRRDGRLRHLLVLEEAHRLLKRAAPGSATAGAVELFASLLAEIRAYGEGVAVVEQIPSKVLPDVVKNTALKIMHRLPAQDDREVVGATMNLQPEQSDAVVALPSGRAAIAADGMDRPVLVQFPLREDVESASTVSTTLPLGRRSELCPDACVLQPCTLGALSAADEIAARPRLIVWIEAMAAALVIGVPPPGPASALRDELLALPDRVRDCGVAHAVERSVAARRPWVHEWMDVTAFTARLRDTAACGIFGEPVDVDDRLTWTVECYRWWDAMLLLEDAVAEHGPDAPPLDLEPRFGLRLYGVTLGAQKAELAADPAFRPGIVRVCVGDVRASLLADAVSRLAGSAGADGVTAALRLSCCGDSVAAVAGQIAELVHEPEGNS